MCQALLSALQPDSFILPLPPLSKVATFLILLLTNE